MKNITCLLLVAAALMSTACAGTKTSGMYYFGKGNLPDGFIRVSPEKEYTDSRGYGWVEDHSNVFGVELPEGNYTVTVGYENAETAAAITVKAESRRLMLMKQKHADKKVREFTVNVRRPEFDGSGRVKLNQREMEPTMIAHWDNLLTLEFLPGTEGIEGIKIEPAPKAITVYVAGDSTVTDQRTEPWSGWGQVLPRFFGTEVAVANHAESGRALFSFLWEKRLDKIISTIKPGDYLFIQFGHNDQKDKRDGAGPFTTYKEELEEYISKAREKDALPVLVTPMERRRWSGGEPGKTLSEYTEAMLQAGREQHVPVINLNAMSLEFYAAMGEGDSKKAFVHYPANSFPDQGQALKDDTHHNVYGAYELARCVVEGIKREVPDLARYLRDDVEAFDPSRPDDADSLEIPASLAVGAEKPEGN